MSPTRKPTAPPTAYVIEAKWEGTSHKWEPASGVPAFNYEDDALRHVALLRREKPSYCGPPMVYRVGIYLRTDVVIEL